MYPAEKSLIKNFIFCAVQWQQMTTSDNERQRVEQRMTTSDDGLQRVTTNDNEWQRMVTSDDKWYKNL